MRVDLHMHTSASDGQFSPREIVEMARKIGLNVIAVTDHDTTDGVIEAQTTAQTGMPITVLAGIELSAEEPNEQKGFRDVHMLGYLLRVDDAVLQGKLEKFRRDRAERGQKIVTKLGELGMPIAWDRVVALAGGGAGENQRVSIGRPHIARAMIEAGYVDSIPDAFNRFLNPDRPAYVARERLSPEGAIALIHQAGGVAVLAHPAKLRDYAAMVERLVPAGLDGVEVVHPANPEGVRLDLRALAIRYGLIMTGGSDFHGMDSQGNISLGAYNPPQNALTALRERATRYAP